MNRVALYLCWLPLLCACADAPPPAPEVEYRWPVYGWDEPQPGEDGALPPPGGPDPDTYAVRHQALALYALPAQVSELVPADAIFALEAESPGVAYWQLERGPQPAPPGARWHMLRFHGGRLAQVRSWSGSAWPRTAWPLDSWSVLRAGGFLSSSVERPVPTEIEEASEQVARAPVWPPNEAQGVAGQDETRDGLAPNWWQQYAPFSTLNAVAGGRLN